MLAPAAVSPPSLGAYATAEVQSIYVGSGGPGALSSRDRGLGEHEIENLSL